MQTTRCLKQGDSSITTTYDYHKHYNFPCIMKYCASIQNTANTAVSFLELKCVINRSSSTVVLRWNCSIFTYLLWTGCSITYFLSQSSSIPYGILQYAVYFVPVYFFQSLSWNTGILEYWCTDVLMYWCTGVLVYSVLCILYSTFQRVISDVLSFTPFKHTSIGTSTTIGRLASKGTTLPMLLMYSYTTNLSFEVEVAETWDAR